MKLRGSKRFKFMNKKAICSVSEEPKAWVSQAHNHDLRMGKYR